MKVIAVEEDRKAELVRRASNLLGRDVSKEYMMDTVEELLNALEKVTDHMIYTTQAIEETNAMVDMLMSTDSFADVIRELKEKGKTAN